MPKFAANGIQLPPGEFGIPPEDPEHPVKVRIGKGRSIGIEQGGDTKPRLTFGLGTAVNAGGMIYVSAVGPVDPETGWLAGDSISAQAAQCLENLRVLLEREGSSLDRIVWANWSLRDPSEFESFSEEWVKWFPDTRAGGPGHAHAAQAAPGRVPDLDRGDRAGGRDPGCHNHARAGLRGAGQGARRTARGADRRSRPRRRPRCRDPTCPDWRPAPSGGGPTGG